jgi:hypothetical protein
MSSTSRFSFSRSLVSVSSVNWDVFIFLIRASSLGERRRLQEWS